MATSEALILGGDAYDNIILAPGPGHSAYAASTPAKLPANFLSGVALATAMAFWL